MAATKRDVDEEYREIELYLQQAQEEIGQALSNLSLNSAGLGQDENANNAVDFTGNSSSLPDITRTPHSSLQPAPTSAFDQVQPRGIQSVDFLAIFAQNNLVADSTSGAESRWNNPGDETWHRTLPNPGRRPAERPKTLTPPPRFPGQGQSRSNYKNRDWRLYVRGEYLFSPIRSEEESSCSTWSTEDRGDSSYMESTKESGASTSEFSAAELSAESSSGGGEAKDVAAAIQNRFAGVSDSENETQKERTAVTNKSDKLNVLQNPGLVEILNPSSEQVSEYENLRSTEDEGDGVEPTSSENSPQRNTASLERDFRDLHIAQKEPSAEKCNGNLPNLAESKRLDDQNVEGSDKKLSKTAVHNECDNTSEKVKSPQVESKGSFRAPNPVSQTLDSCKAFDSTTHSQDISKVLNAVGKPLGTSKSSKVATQCVMVSPSKIKTDNSASSMIVSDRKKVVSGGKDRRSSEPCLELYTEPPRLTNSNRCGMFPTVTDICDTSCVKDEKHEVRLKSSKRQCSPEKTDSSPDNKARSKRSRSKSDPMGMIPLHIQQRASLNYSLSHKERKSDDLNVLSPSLRHRGELSPPFEPPGGAAGVVSPQSGRKNNVSGILSPRSERRKAEKVSRSTQTFKGRKVDSRLLPRAVVKPERSGKPVGDETSKPLAQQTNASLDLDNNNRSIIKDVCSEKDVAEQLKQDTTNQNTSSLKLGKEKKTLHDVIDIIEPPKLIDGPEKGVCTVQLEAESVKKENEINSSLDVKDKTFSQCDSAKDLTVKVEVHVTSCDDDEPLTIQQDPVLSVLPRGYGSRERRVRVMPAIAEDDRQTDEETDNEEVFDSRSNSSLKKTHSRTLSTSSSATTVSDGQRSPDSQAPSITQSDSSQAAAKPASLLDSLHRKYYPDQYRGKARSAEALLGSDSTGSLDDSVVGHCKSASFAGTLNIYSKDNVIDRLSDSQIGAKLSALNGHSSDSGSPGSTLSPPTSRRAKDKSKTKDKSKMSAKKREPLPEVSTRECNQNCQPQEEEEHSYSEREQAEIEAVEACKWLRTTGFPQYAQMYEDQLFPIDIPSVQKDHDFLDPDSIQSLFRRLNTLNKCATMKIEAPPRKTADDSDEEEQCALSDKWRYQRSSRRWSRKDLDLGLQSSSGDDGFERGGLRSCSSHDSVLTDNEESLSQQDDSPLLATRTSHGQSSSSDVFLASSPLDDSAPRSPLLIRHASTPARHSESDIQPVIPASPPFRRSASDRFRGAKNFLKRMESLKTKKSKKSGKLTVSKVEISGPVLMDTGSVQERMDQLGCVDISPSTENAPSPLAGVEHRPANQSDSFSSDHTSGIGHSSPAMSKRSGRVFSELDNSFPNSSFGDSTTSSDVTGSAQAGLHLSPPLGHKRNHSSSDVNEVFTTGSDHQPGSFPKVISNGYIEVGNGSQINYRTGSFNLGSDSDQYRDSFLRRTKTSPTEQRSAKTTACAALSSDVKAENRLSIYDNVPLTDVSDPQKELDLILSDLFKNISGLSQTLGDLPADDSSTKDESIPLEEVIRDLVVDSTESSTLLVGSGSESTAVMVEPTDPVDPDPPVAHNKSDSVEPAEQAKVNNLRVSESSAVSTVSTTSGSTGSSSSNQEMSDGDTPCSREEDGSDPVVDKHDRERRDSGVGSSLTRAPSDRRRHRIRWHSFVKSHRPSFNSRSLQICNMSAGQLMLLRKLSLLKVTALMEKYSPSNRSGWNWMMPKFMKRFKAPDYRDKNVFGVPLLVILQRTGQPLPQCILYAMRCLRRTARDAVGIFRKSGVRSRIQKLRNQIEANSESVDFEALQSYDVADLLKQYFRELPECLLTNKLSETFISIYTHIPADLRIEALQAAVMLLPDENREVLQSLLLFLSDMAEHASENQMNASNLAVCFAPSLFHMCGTRITTTAASSPRRSRKNMGLPDQRELLEQKSAHECLTNMILNCKKLFMVPEEMMGKCRLSYIEQGDPVPIEELGRRRFDEDTPGHVAYIESCIQGLLKESRDRWKGWVSISTMGNIEVAYKKVGDGHPLRLWKCSTDVEAPPIEVLNRILRERHLWDDDLLKWRVVERLDKDTEVFQYVTNTMAPHPTHDFTELRSWRAELPKGACVLVSTSVEHAEAPLIGGVRGVVLASRFLIEPCGSGKSRLTHVCRIDLRGHTPEWYNKAYGHHCSNHMARIRDSFKQNIEESEGPETKV